MNAKEKIARIILATANEAGDRAVEQYRARQSAPLFYTVSGKPIYHGDEFWCFYEGQKHSANLKRANSKFDYNDGQPRFADKAEAQEAIRVYTWLNGPYDGQ